MPRRRPSRAQATSRLGVTLAVVTVLGGISDAAAQTEFPPAGVLNPQSEFDPTPPPRFDPAAPRYGNPPGSGAGKTGFVSAKPKPKKATAAARPLPRAATTRVVPIAPLPAPAALPPLPAQQPTTTGAIPYRPQTRPKVAETDPYAPLGLRSGSFLLYPAIELSGGYDTNPNRTKHDEQGSSLFIVAPELRARSDWERHEFRADLRGSYTTYNSMPDLNRPHFQSVLDGRIDWTSQTRIELQKRFLLSTTIPGSPDFEADVAEPTIFTNVGGSAGVVHRLNRLELGGKVSIDRLRYEESLLTDGTHASNADRDLFEYGLQLRGSYELTPGFKPFLQVEIDRRVHDLSVDSAGFERDSTGLEPRLGTTFEFTRLLTGAASVGYLTRDYEDPRLEDLSGIVADASLVWSATPLTTATFTARSTAYESTDADVSGVLARDFGVQVDHAFRLWLLGTLKFGYGMDDYVGSAREDQRFTAAAALTYKLNQMARIKAEVRRESRSSDDPDDEYVANIFLLGLRLQR